MFYYLVMNGDNPVGWFRLEFDESAQVLGNLENYPGCYVQRVSRDDLEAHFGLDEDD